jgi:GntR family transcriptional regulator, rspAB operon transcriptional repressor
MALLDQKKENRSLTSIIFERIREDILNLRYRIGEKLVEAKLAEEMGVSRTPVREALKQLELDGLVENIPNRGVVVKGISSQDIADIYSIRVAIEGIAVGWAIDRMDKEGLDELSEIYDLMDFYTSKDDCDKIFELNTRFHETIYRATKSRYLESVLKDFQIFLRRTRNESLKSPGRLKEALLEHKAILDSIRSHDSEAAYKRIVDHIEKSRQNAIRMRLGANE